MASLTTAPVGRRLRRSRPWNRAWLTCTIAAINPLSGVLSEAWAMYRAHAAHLLAIAFVIYLAAAILTGLLSLAGVVGSLLGSVVGLFAAFLLQAALVKAVQDVRDGRADLSLGETVSAVTHTSGLSRARRSWPGSLSPSGSS